MVARSDDAGAVATKARPKGIADRYLLQVNQVLSSSEASCSRMVTPDIVTGSNFCCSWEGFITHRAHLSAAVDERESPRGDRTD